MTPDKKRFLLLNAIGGVAVLGSYVHGLMTQADPSAGLWGGVPESLQPLYTVNMLLAAAGYFLFTSYFLWKTDASTRFFGTQRFGVILAFYAAILIPSALWMPLTFQYLAAPSAALWWGIRLDLALVGLGSLGLLAALLSVRPREARVWHGLAILGLLPFCLQTAILDATVWPHYFPR